MKREWLIEFRKSKQLTQEQVASSSFIDRAYYSNIESGKRTPSLIVAENIAKTLNFNPLKFFQDRMSDELLKNFNNPFIPNTPTKYVTNVDKGNILYLYNDFDCYIRHAVIFLKIGIEKGNHCIFMDTQNHILQIQNHLENIFIKEILDKHIKFIVKTNINFENPVNTPFINQLIIKDSAHIRMWVYDEINENQNWELQLQNYLNKLNLSHTNTLLVCSYNAATLSARNHLQMMRTFPLLMTDIEVVKSPLYLGENKTVNPSLYLQEDM